MMFLKKVFKIVLFYHRYKKGSEVFNSYGRRQNDNLLLDYGFCLLDNEWDHLEFPFQLVSPNASLADSWRSKPPSINSTIAIDETRNSIPEALDNSVSLNDTTGETASDSARLFDDKLEIYHMKLMLIRNNGQTTIRTLKIDKLGLPIEVTFT